MRHLALRFVVALTVTLALAFPFAAAAGETTPYGVIQSTGTAVTNATTSSPFVIPPNTQISIQCDAAAHMLTDATTVATSGATRGVKVAADQLLPVWVGSMKTTTVSSTTSAQVAIISVSGTANCWIYPRSGRE